MKKIVSFMLSALLVLSAVYVVPFSAVSEEDNSILKLKAYVVGNDTISPGKQFTIVVSIDENPGFAGMRMTFSMPSGFTVENFENKVASLNFAQSECFVWDDANNYSDTGELLRITISAYETINPGIYQFDFVVKECCNEDLDDIQSVINSVSLTVSVTGDVNGDGAIGVKDIVLFRKYLANQDPDTLVSSVSVTSGADANSDGVIDLKDLVLLRKYVSNVDPMTGESSIILGYVSNSDNCVASIGENYFDTLSKAFEVCRDGDTIKILKDFSTNEAAQLCSKKNINIDGQGHKIVANIALMGFINAFDSEVSVQDLEIEYTESTYSVANGVLGCAAFSIENESKIALENIDVVSFWGDCVNISSGSDCHIISGSYSVSITNNSMMSNVFCINLNSNLTVDDGNFSRMGINGNKRALMRLNGQGAKATINGGTWQSSIGRLYMWNGSAAAYDSPENTRKIVINNGQFIFGVDDPGTVALFDPAFYSASAQGGDVEINGGYFKVKENCQIDMFSNKQSKNRIVVNGGTFENASGTLLSSIVKTNTTISTTILGSLLIINGGTFTNSSGILIDESSPEECLIISGGTFYTANSSEADTIRQYLSFDSTAVIN